MEVRRRQHGHTRFRFVTSGWRLKFQAGLPRKLASQEGASTDVGTFNSGNSRKKELEEPKEANG